MSTVAEKVQAIFVEQLGAWEDEVTLSARIVDDLSCDSLDAIELVMAFEEEFGIEIPDEDMDAQATVGDVVAYLERRQQERTRA